MAVARTGNVEGRAGCCSSTAPPSTRGKSWGGQTALMWASARRHPEMMQLLIAKGADVNAALDRSRLPASRDGRGASEEPGQRRIHAAALCRARELRRVRRRAAQEQRGHRPAGSRWRLAAAAGDHECELGPREAADRGRRRRQSMGHLRRGAAVHARSACAARSTADARRSIRRTRRRASRSSVCCSSAAPNPNMQLFFKPANVRGGARRSRAAPRR